MKHYERRYLINESGFTLIELMISLVLGLLISAAVIQVYIINAKTLTVQQSASEVQDSTIFSLQSLNDHIRLANLGNPISNITDTTKNGGIVLTADNADNVATDYMTISAGQEDKEDENGWTGVSNIKDVASDQLTIQYKNITPSSLYDCQGAEIEDDSNWVIERYFVRLGTNATAKTGMQNLVLACDAGRIDSDGEISGFGGDGEVIIPAVEQFKVLLGTLTDVNNLTYIPAKTYLELTDGPPITTIKIGIIVRSTTPLITDTDKENFLLLGESQVLKTDEKRKKYYRRDYESTILLRNARVMSVTGIPVVSQ